nr:putative reverse transcriptase domain-containing protein [Tanacetum cinerariifolium]
LLEALYERKCRSSVLWAEIGESSLIGPKLVQEMTNKVDKTLHFVKKPVDIMEREVKALKHSKTAIVKVRWSSKHGPEFTWECEDHMKA